MINFIISNLKSIGGVIAGFFAIYVLKQNKDLTIKNDCLKQENLAKEKELIIKKEILKIEENYKPTSLNVAVNRVLSKKSK